MYIVHSVRNELKGQYQILISKLNQLNSIAVYIIEYHFHKSQTESYFPTNPINSENQHEVY